MPPVLISFIEKNLRGIALSAKEFTSGAFASRLPDLFALGRVEPQGLNGAEQVARFIFSLMRRTGRSDE